MAANQSISVGQVQVEPGQVATVNLPVADLYTSTSLNMPLKVICGKRRGPVLFVSAAVHGDELNGVEIIRRLLRRKSLRSLRGTLLAVPIVNVHGFLDQSRYLPDRRDLNRSFPGSPSGSIAARLANTFMKEVVLKSDFGVDLHTGAIDRDNLPQIRAFLDDIPTAEIAAAFGAPVIVNASIREGSLRACAAQHDIPTIVYEAGEALRFDEVSILAGVRGILRVMRHIGMLPARKQERKAAALVARSTHWVRATTSGIVNAKVGLGTRVKEGQSLAQISDPLGDREEIMAAPFDGIIIGRSRLPLAHEGDALFHLAAFGNAAHAETAVEEFAATHDPALRRTVENKLRGT